MERSWCSHPATNRRGGTSSTFSQRRGNRFVEESELRIMRPELGFGVRLALIETIAFADLIDPLMNRIGIRTVQIRMALVALAIASDQKRESLFQERKENLARARFQKQYVAAESGCPRRPCGSG